MIDEILEYNRRFVAEKRYERFITDKYPNLSLIHISEPTRH